MVFLFIAPIALVVPFVLLFKFSRSTTKTVFYSLLIVISFMIFAWRGFNYINLFLYFIPLSFTIQYALADIQRQWEANHPKRSPTHPSDKNNQTSTNDSLDTIKTILLADYLFKKRN